MEAIRGLERRLGDEVRVPLGPDPELASGSVDEDDDAGETVLETQLEEGPVGLVLHPGEGGGD